MEMKKKNAPYTYKQLHVNFSQKKNFKMCSLTFGLILKV